MALTIISNPSVSTTKVSFSYPAIIVVQGSSYGTSNVTQHRFKLVINEGATELITKYTVVDDTANKQGRFDIRKAVQSVLSLSRFGAVSGDDITKITTPQALSITGNKTLTVYIYEEYYLSGTFTSNGPETLTFKAYRGWTDQANNVWNYENWNRRNDIENFISYSGKGFQVYPQMVDRATWPTTAAKQYMGITLSVRPSGNITIYWFDRTAANYSPVVYIPMVHTLTQADSSTGLRVQIGVNTVAGPGTNYEEVEDYTIYKNVDICVDDDIVLMFLDSLFQWNFMHFNKKHVINLRSNADSGELVPEATNPGRFRYNVKTSETWTLNTDWMNENQNPLIEDLFSSEFVYIVDQDDGSLEHCVIVPNSLRLKTSRNDSMIQYEMSIVKSLDNFKA